MLSILNKKEKLQFSILALLMLVGSILEALGVSIVIPVTSLVLDPASLQRFPQVQAILHALPLEGHGWRIMAVLLLVGVFLVKSAFLSFINWQQYKTIFGIEKRLSQALFSKYLLQPYARHHELKSSDAINNVIRVTSTFCVSVLLSLATVFSEATALLAIVAILLFLEPLGTLLVFTVLGAFGAAFYVLTRDKMSQWGNARQDNEGHCFEDVKDGVGGIKEIKILGIERAFKTRFAQHSNISAEAARLYLFTQQLPRIWLELIAVLAVACLLITMMLSGKSGADIFPVVSAFGIAAFRMLPSASKVISAFANIRYGTPSIKTLQKELKEDQAEGWQEEPKPGMAAFKFQENISVHNLSFGYPSREGMVLKNVNLSFKKGDCLGIIGESGSGKSTLTDLMLGLLHPTTGSINIDGRDIWTDIRAWRAQIGYVAQTTYLMNASLRSNIAFGVPPEDINDARMAQVIKEARLSDFIASLPKGLDTNMGDNGVMLSGGQRQRIGIARALYRNPEILILDEATSALDAETEASVIQSIGAMVGTRSMIIVSHRPAPLEICNRVIQVKDACVLEQSRER